LAGAGLALAVLVLAGLILSRIPDRVEVSGGQVEVVLPTSTATPRPEPTPTLTETAKATPAPMSTRLPAESPPGPPAPSEVTLLAHWPFDGTFEDASGHGHDLQAVGENLPFVPGCFGGAVQFEDDPANYLTRGQDDPAFDFGDGDYSVELWVKLDQSPSQSHEQALMEKCSQAGGCGLDGWGLTVIEDDSLRFVQNPGEHGTTDTPAGLFNQSGTWYHLVAVRQGDRVDVYVDGERVASGPASDVADSDNPLIIGRRADDEQRFPLIGALDEVMLYEGALSAPEVQAHYEGAGGCLLPPVDELREQARVLAEPILSGIADRPPDYEESFRDPESGWPGGSTAAGDEWGYQDDAYIISATYLPQGECCIGAGPEPEPLFSDFVLELEAQFLAGDWGLWGVTFRELAGTETPGDHYALGFWPDGNFRVWKNIGGAHIELKEADEYLRAFESGFETNRLTVIAQGPHIAFYMNGEPLWYVYDESVSEGGVQLMAENLEPDTLLQVRYEDLKVWDISEAGPP
jgi:hypothetical protein